MSKAQVGLKSTQTQVPAGAAGADMRLLDDSSRTDVWPDSVQVIDGQLSMRLPTGCSGVALFRSAARRSP